MKMGIGRRPPASFTRDRDFDLRPTRETAGGGGAETSVECGESASIVIGKSDPPSYQKQ
jgi:hypothetical protein